MGDYITLNHGSGGRLSGKLIMEIFAGRFGMGTPLTDSAIITGRGKDLAVTTDSYVVDPLFFPGGNIGKLAVCGTVNDIAVSGATPACLAASFIIEEGFPVSDLTQIAESMSEEAKKASVKIVTGDTKVVEKGKCHSLFITTSGVGFLAPEHKHISTGAKVSPGDRILINGAIGSHSIAVLGARKNLGFRTPVISDCASLNHFITRILDATGTIHFMRDITRGGLGTVLNELAMITGNGIVINESSVPVEEPVRGICEILGFDPLYLANEGKVLIVAGEQEYKNVLGLMRSFPEGEGSEVIGEITDNKMKMVIMNTTSGGQRVVDFPNGIQLPRIC